MPPPTIRATRPATASHTRAVTPTRATNSGLLPPDTAPRDTAPPDTAPPDTSRVTARHRPDIAAPLSTVRHREVATRRLQTTTTAARRGPRIPSRADTPNSPATSNPVTRRPMPGPNTANPNMAVTNRVATRHRQRHRNTTTAIRPRVATATTRHRPRRTTIRRSGYPSRSNSTTAVAAPTNCGRVRT